MPQLIEITRMWIRASTSSPAPNRANSRPACYSALWRALKTTNPLVRNQRILKNFLLRARQDSNLRHSVP
jgi:hypothetical protein